MAYRLSKRRVIMAGSAGISILCLLGYGLFLGTNSKSLSNTLIQKDLSEKQLKLVHLLFRHEVRTPADTYPNDPYINHTFYPYGWGQVTNEGKFKLYKLGQWLQIRYKELLPKFYKPDVLHAQATGISRTYMSLAALLAGLWPPKDTPMEWNKFINWQPIPIISQSLNTDDLLLVRVSCPRYYEALNEISKKEPFQQILNENQKLFENLTNITGLNINNFEDVESLYSTLVAEEAFGLELPSWTKFYYPKKLKELSELSYIQNVATTEMKRIKGGPFIKKMADEWNDKRKNNITSKEKKIFIYAGHDSSVANVLSALNIWDQQIPTYGIMTMFELYQDILTEEYSIQIYLKNSTEISPYPLTIPGCEFNCPLDKVLQLIKTIASVDLKRDCIPHNQSFIEPSLGGP